MFQQIINLKIQIRNLIRPSPRNPEHADTSTIKQKGQKLNKTINKEFYSKNEKH